VLPLDNTNWRASGPGGPCFQMKNVNYCRRTGGLHRRQDRRAGRQAAQKGGAAGCEKGQPCGPAFSAAQFNVQPAGPP